MALTETVGAKINATDYGTFTPCPGFPDATVFEAVSFGGYAANTCAFDIRDIKVGTAGYGSSDIFAPVLADLSEFTGIFGNDGSIVASGGVLSVDSATGDHYGYFNITPIVGPIYFQFGLRVRTGNGDPDYADIWDDASAAAADGTCNDGIFGGWLWDGCGDGFGTGPSGDPTWDTINLVFSFAGVPPPVVGFHIAS